MQSCRVEGHGRCKAEEQAAEANDFWLELGLTERQGCRSLGCSEVATAGGSGESDEGEEELEGSVCTLPWCLLPRCAPLSSLSLAGEILEGIRGKEELGQLGDSR